MTRKPEVRMIVATDRRGAIGLRGEMLCHLPEDLRHFKELTMGCPVVMGRRTWESLPKRPLPGRRNVVITRQAGYDAPGAELAPSLGEALSLLEGEEKIYIIGGGQVYAEALPLADGLDLTVIDREFPEADTYFPEVRDEEWSKEEGEMQYSDKSGLHYRYVTCRRR